jgi:hypothetical protein
MAPYSSLGQRQCYQYLPAWARDVGTRLAAARWVPWSFPPASLPPGDRRAHGSSTTRPTTPSSSSRGLAQRRTRDVLQHLERQLPRTRTGTAFDKAVLPTALDPDLLTGGYSLIVAGRPRTFEAGAPDHGPSRPSSSSRRRLATPGVPQPSDLVADVPRAWPDLLARRQARPQALTVAAAAEEGRQALAIACPHPRTRRRPPMEDQAPAMPPFTVATAAPEGAHGGGMRGTHATPTASPLLV